MEFLKSLLRALYEIFGINHPKASLFIVCAIGAIFGAFLFGMLWLSVAREYENAGAFTGQMKTVFYMVPPKGIMFWGFDGKTITPIHGLYFLSLVNRREGKSQIEDYVFEVEHPVGKWNQISISLPLAERYFYAWGRKGLSNARPANFPLLDARLLDHQFEAGETVDGWVPCRFPEKLFGIDHADLRYRLTVRDSQRKTTRIIMQASPAPQTGMTPVATSTLQIGGQEQDLSPFQITGAN